MGEAIRGLLRSSSSRHQPWQLAAAIAMGVLCGLLPKLNFAFCVVGLACILLPIHLPLAALACVVISLPLSILAPLAGRLGIWSLTHPWLRDLWLALDALPLIPWLGLHNSVVHGSLLIGLGMWLPVFLLVKPAARRLAPTSDQTAPEADDPDFVHELKPAVAAPGRQTNPLPAHTFQVEPSSAGLAASPPASSGTPSIRQTEETCAELQLLLESCTSDAASSMSVEQVVQRASQIAEFVDELLTASEPSESPNTPTLTGRVALQADSEIPTQRHSDANSDSCSDASGRASGRADSIAESSYQAVEELPRTRQLSAARPFQSQEFAIGPVSAVTGELRKPHEQHIAATGTSARAHEASVGRAAGGERQQEALRYLLHHLKAFKEKV